MIPADFHEFFTAMVGAAAALIGLLFVAISVAPQRFVEAETRSEAQTLAGSALIAFLNVLICSSIALIPDVELGWAALILGLGGLAFSAASARSLFEARRRGHAERAWYLLLVGLLVVFGLEFAEGIRLMLDSENSLGAIDTIAALLIASLSLGIGRAWRLVGMRNTGMFGSVHSLLHGEDEPA